MCVCVYFFEIATAGFSSVDCNTAYVMKMCGWAVVVVNKTRMMLWWCEEIDSAEQCEAALCALVGALPPHHSSTLQHLMAHFCRMCCMHEEYGHGEPSDRLCHVFCHVLLRPPWENIAYVDCSFSIHYNIVMALIRTVCCHSWDQQNLNWQNMDRTLTVIINITLTLTLILTLTRNSN